MSYLQLRRSRLLLACFLLSSLLLWIYPDIDIHISRIFFDEGFGSSDQWWHVLARKGLAYVLAVSMGTVLVIYGCGKFYGRMLFGIDGKRVSYLLLVLLLGAGLIVNVIFKDNFGRARPRDIEEFGGSKQFTAAFVLSDQCEDNCSFSSGEGAGGFFPLALAFALSKKRRVFVAAVAFGSLVSLTRIAAGGHFFSDTVVSFFVMLLLADILRHSMLVPNTRSADSLRPIRQRGPLHSSLARESSG